MRVMVGRDFAFKGRAHGQAVMRIQNPTPSHTYNHMPVYQLSERNERLWRGSPPEGAMSPPLAIMARHGSSTYKTHTETTRSHCAPLIMYHLPEWRTWLTRAMMA